MPPSIETYDLNPGISFTFPAVYKVIPAFATMLLPGSISIFGILSFFISHISFIDFATCFILPSISNTGSLFVYLTPYPPPRLSWEIS